MARKWVGTPATSNAHIATRQEVIDKADRLRFNALEHGCVADKTTDNAVPLQALVDQVGALGGGTLLFPPGDYLVNNLINMRDNVWYEGQGANFYKTSGTYVFFYAGGDTSRPAGYGNGVKNVRCTGITFWGDYDAGLYRCAMNLHHAQDVVIEQCRFIECHGGAGHVFDMGGCERVTFRDCVFQGYCLPAGADNATRKAECIQLDQSQYGSVGGTVGTFDGALCRYITVDNCKFIPYTKGATTYPAPTPLAGHGLREGQQYVGIKFINNWVEDNVEQIAPDTSLQEQNYGIIHLPVARDLLIANNTFVMTQKRSTRVISLQSWDSEILATSDPNTSPTKGTFATPTVCREIRIVNNIFRGYAPADGAATPQEMIWLSGLSNGLITDVVISGNLFFSNYNANNTATARPAMTLTYCNRVQVTGNEFVGLAYGPKFVNCTDVAVVGCTFNAVRNYACYFANTAGFTFTGNTVSAHLGPVQCDLNCLEGVFSGNVFTGATDTTTASTPMVLLGKEVAVCNNSMRHASTGPRAIAISGSTTSKLTIMGNVAVGYTRGLDISGTAALTTTNLCAVVGNIGVTATTATGSVVANNI